MRLIYSISKALDKWLKTELPSFEGTRKGRKTLVSDANSLCWQLHIIDNCYQSSEKTIIATEAHSRFTCFIPVTSSLTLSELHQKLTMLWQALLVDMINAGHSYSEIRSNCNTSNSQISRIKKFKHLGFTTYGFFLL